MFMLRVCRLIEEGLNQDSTSIGPLKPCFILIGSVPEGSRVDQAIEADLNVTFQALEDKTLLMDESACAWTVPNVAAMEPFTTDKGGKVFDYPKFFSTFVQEVAKVMQSRAAAIPGFSFKEHQPCQGCKAMVRMDHEPYSHCHDCCPTVTHTKRGACVVLKGPSNPRNTDGDLLSIDLCPLFPVAGKSKVQLFQLLMKTLVKARPKGWCHFLGKYLNKDSLPPEVMTEEESAPEQKRYIGIKILNYVQEPQAIIMPGQELTISSELEMNAMLKETYLLMKGIKTVLEVSVPSYTLKTVLSMVLSSARLFSNYHTVSRKRLVHQCLQHPFLKRHFAHKVDYEQWQGSAMIPLL